jgi:hypothetical protein
LAALPEPGAQAGIEALAELTARYGLLGLDEVLLRWARR